MRKRILIVEDELIAAEYLREILEENGFDVLGVIDTGEEAIKQAGILNPDIILMDIMLRDHISGSEAALKIHQKNPKIAIVFLTAYSDDQSIDYAIGANSYAYLMKPYQEKEIVATLKVICGKLSQENKAHTNIRTHILQIESDLIYNRQLKKLIRDKKELILSSKAIQFIDLLCKTPNISVSNEQISLHIWQEEKSATTLRTLVHRIRHQLDRDIIVNVNSLGYMIKTKSEE